MPVLTENERQIFDYLIKPDDSYDSNGIYWADLPFGKRVKFIREVDNAEAKRELAYVWNMFKKDPLEPMRAYFRNMVVPGAGLGLEGYVLFSIGNLQPLFGAVGAFHSCWKTYQICDQNLIAAVQYMEIIGIIVGQILVGFIGDYLGRRWGLIQDATIMFLGLIMLTASWGVTQNGWVACYAVSLLFYSVGVGGEYPMTATSSMENAVGSGKISTREDRLHRGRKVTSAFLMQGWGQLANQAILIILLLVFHGGDSLPYTQSAVQWTYRVSFAIPAVGTLWLVYFRTYKMKAASKTLEIEKAKKNVTGYDVQSLKLTLKYFGPRLLATAGTWFFNDVFFYGNKLFQSNFISIISPNTADIIPNWLWNLVNVGVSLVGYYLASFLIDNKLYGRKNMMTVGFLMDFILFVVPAFNFQYYKSSEHIHAFQAMYFLSSFFNQFGPNSVTFLVAAECFPTPVRATAHGFSAACGKMGALLAAVLYSYIGDQTKFYFIPWWGLAGVILTVIFMPDTTGLDLKEQERRWAYITAGKEEHYHGIAVHPQHLSLWERWRGAGKYYNAEMDYRQKIEEMRGEWEAAQAVRATEKGGRAAEADVQELEADAWSSGVSTYFQTTQRSPVVLAEERQVPGTFSLGEPARVDTSSSEDEKKAA